VILTPADLDQYRKEHTISLSGTNSEYRHCTTFEESGIPENVLQVCKSFKAPTPIQSQCWPILLSGRDLVAIAETGSGKTLAFTLPGLVHILSQTSARPPQQGPYMLVLSPTRELASQSANVIAEACKSCNLSSTCVYGGIAKHDQRRIIKKGVHIVIATPGRLKDLFEEKSIKLSNVTYLILDEADRMLDEGFEKDIQFLMAKTNPERQIGMFSATWPDTVQKLAHELLHKPVKVVIGDIELTANKRITQIVDVVDPKDKNQILIGLLEKYHKSRQNRILIFTLYKKEATRVEKYLWDKGWKVAAIHGDKSQTDRTRAVESFIDGSVPLLVATDVAARGLDIPGVEYVINYTFPLTIEDYVHRIGRTARAGKTGVSHTLFTQHDRSRAGELVDVLRSTSQTIPPSLEKFGPSIKKKKEHEMYGSWHRDIDMNQKSTRITFDD